MSGLIVLAFLIFHILHFTLGQVQPEYFHTSIRKDRYDAYSMFVRGFQNPGIYASTSSASACSRRTSVTAPRRGCSRSACAIRSIPTDRLGPLVAIVLFVGYMIPPTAVLVGFIKLPGA